MFSRIVAGHRDSWPAAAMSLAAQFLQDLVYASRILLRNPTFTVVVILVLGLGIGLNTVLYSIFDVLIINPYQFPDPGRLVSVDARHISGKNSSAGFADYSDWREQNRSFAEMAIEPWVSSRTLTGMGDARRVTVCRTTASFFNLLQVSPSIGRTFSPREDRPGAPAVILLSEATWRQFGSRPDVLSNSVTIDSTAYTVIGVMPPRLRFPGIRHCDFWIPLRESPEQSRYQHQYSVWARLKPDVSIQQAQADMTAIAQRLEKAYPATNTGWGIIVEPLGNEITRRVQGPLALLGTALFSVLLLICANVAGLLLARGSARSEEIAIRASLGAGRGRLIRQMLTESLLLALLACGFGLIVSVWLIDLLLSWAPLSAGLDGMLKLNLRVAAFSVALSFLTTLLFGLLPALHTSRTDWSSAIRGRRRPLSYVVVAEVAISLALLACAGLLTRGLLSALSVELGLRT
jgi:putative ABC transport system permease protein